MANIFSADDIYANGHECFWLTPIGRIIQEYLSNPDLKFSLDPTDGSYNFVFPNFKYDRAELWIYPNGRAFYEEFSHEQATSDDFTFDYPNAIFTRKIDLNLHMDYENEMRAIFDMIFKRIHKIEEEHHEDISTDS